MRKSKLLLRSSTSELFFPYCIEPISKCFAFLKLAFEVCLHMAIINYLKRKLLTKTSLLLFARASITCAVLKKNDLLTALPLSYRFKQIGLADIAK